MRYSLLLPTSFWALAGSLGLAVHIASAAIPPPAPARPGDGINTIHGILQSRTGYGWSNIAAMHNLLVAKGADPARLHVLVSDTGTPASDSGIIDGLATRATLDAAFAACAAEMDADDIFLWEIEAVGEGYMGWVPDDPDNLAYHGWVSGTLRVSDVDDELDFREGEFEFSVLCAAGGLKDGRDFHYGLGEWGVNYYQSLSLTLVRYQALSTFTDVYVVGRGLLSDGDERIERFTDYLAGDTNQNGTIEPALGEVADFDGDGQPPWVRATGVFDEDDWGPLDRFEDNLTYGHSLLPGFTYALFDAGFDGRLDIDVNPSGPLVADGTDVDNDGCIDFIDLNQDGDLDDWVQVDETLGLYQESLDDDELAAYLGVLTNGTKVVITNTCWGGGYIDDLSAPNTIIIAGSREDCRAPAGFLHQYLHRAFTIRASEADVDGNGRVSLLEAFNHASVHPGTQTAMGMDRLVYDDNGDFFGHEDPLPNGGDGALGAVTFFDRNRMPEIVTAPVLSARAGETYNYPIAATDADIGDPLTIALTAAPSWLALVDQGNGTAVLAGTPAQTDVGVAAVVVSVRDRLGATNVQAFDVTVTGNTAPGFAAPFFTMPGGTEGVTYTGTIADRASDPDVGDSLTFARVSGPAWLTVDADGSLHGTPGTGDVGTAQFVVSATDGEGASATATMSIAVAARPVFVDVPTSQTAVAGTVSGSLAAVVASDNSYQVIAEILSPTKNGYSFLEHRWTINVTGGAQVVFGLEAHRTASSDGDTMIFTYSVDGSTFLPLVTVNKTTDDNTVQTVSLPAGLQGPIIVRVVDSDRNRRQRSIDRIFIDQMYVRSQ